MIVRDSRFPRGKDLGPASASAASNEVGGTLISGASEPGAQASSGVERRREQWRQAQQRRRMKVQGK